MKKHESKKVLSLQTRKMEAKKSTSSSEDTSFDSSEDESFDDNRPEGRHDYLTEEELWENRTKFWREKYEEDCMAYLRSLESANAREIWLEDENAQLHQKVVALTDKLQRRRTVIMVGDPQVETPPPKAATKVASPAKKRAPPTPTLGSKKGAKRTKVAESTPAGKDSRETPLLEKDELKKGTEKK